MGNRHRAQLQKEYEEAAMRLMMHEYAQADGARLLRQFAEAEENGQSVPVPPELDQRCREAIRDHFSRNARKNRCRRLLRHFRNGAAWCLAVLILTAVALLSLDGLRIPVMNLLIKSGFTFPSSQASPSVSSYSDSLIRELRNQLSGEYTLILEEWDEVGSGFLLFQNQSQELVTLNISDTAGQVCVDTEDVHCETVLFHGVQAYLLTGNGCRLIWTREETGQLYDLYASNMDTAAFRSLADNIFSNI